MSAYTTERYIIHWAAITARQTAAVLREKKMKLTDNTKRKHPPKNARGNT